MITVWYMFIISMFLLYLLCPYPNYWIPALLRWHQWQTWLLRPCQTTAHLTHPLLLYRTAGFRNLEALGQKKLFVCILSKLSHKRDKLNTKMNEVNKKYALLTTIVPEEVTFRVASFGWCSWMVYWRRSPSSSSQFNAYIVVVVTKS